MMEAGHGPLRHTFHIIVVTLSRDISGPTYRYLSICTSAYLLPSLLVNDRRFDTNTMWRRYSWCAPADGRHAWQSTRYVSWGGGVAGLADSELEQNGNWKPDKRSDRLAWKRFGRSVYLSTYLSIYRSIHLPIDLSIYLSIYPSIYLSIYLSIYPSIDLSVYLSIYACMHACTVSIVVPSCLFSICFLSK